MQNSNHGAINAIPNGPFQSEIKYEQSDELNNIGGDFIIEEKFIPEDPRIKSPETTKFYMCKGCSKLYILRKPFEDHLSSCQELGKQCRNCRKYFPSNAAYSAHFQKCQEYCKKIGNDHDRFICPASGCLAEFKSLAYLRSHQTAVHSERRFICQFCGFKFKLLRQKKRHLKLNRCRSKKEASTNSFEHPKDEKSKRQNKKKHSKHNINSSSPKKIEKNDSPGSSKRPKRSTRKEVEAKLEMLGGEDSDSSRSSRTSATASLNSILEGNDQDDLQSDSELESESDEEMQGSEDSDREFSKKSGPSRKVKGHRYQIHRSVDPKSIFHCGNCKQSFDIKSEYETHWEICEQITYISGDFIKCKFPDCPATYPKEWPSHYNAHLDKKHYHKSSGSTKRPPPRLYTCDLCQKNWFSGPKN